MNAPSVALRSSGPSGSGPIPSAASAHRTATGFTGIRRRRPNGPPAESAWGSGPPSDRCVGVGSRSMRWVSDPLPVGRRCHHLRRTVVRYSTTMPVRTTGRAWYTCERVRRPPRGFGGSTGFPRATPAARAIERPTGRSVRVTPARPPRTRSESGERERSEPPEAGRTALEVERFCRGTGDISGEQGLYQVSTTPSRRSSTQPRQSTESGS